MCERLNIADVTTEMKWEAPNLSRSIAKTISFMSYSLEVSAMFSSLELTVIVYQTVHDFC